MRRGNNDLEFSLPLKTPNPQVKERMYVFNRYLQTSTSEQKAAESTCQLKSEQDPGNRKKYEELCKLEKSRVIQRYKPLMKAEYARAIAESILSGCCGNDCVFNPPFPELKLDDTQFKIMLDALWTKPICREDQRARGVIFNFPENILSDASLSHLSKVIKDRNFSHAVVIDLSDSKTFTNAGAHELLTALNTLAALNLDELDYLPGGMGITIKLPDNPNMVDKELLRQINERQKENRERYMEFYEKHYSKKAGKHARLAARSPRKSQDKSGTSLFSKKEKAEAAVTRKSAVKKAKDVEAQEVKAEKPAGKSGLWRRKTEKTKEEESKQDKEHYKKLDNL